MRNRNARTIIAINNNFRKDKIIIFQTYMKKILFGITVSIIFSLSLLLLITPKDIEAQKAESEIEEEMCVSYNKSEKLISITCKYADFSDVTRQITDPEILKLEPTAKATTSTKSTNTTNTSKNNNYNSKKVYLLNSGLKVEKNANLDIDSNDVTWLKIIPSEKSPNAIEVDGSLKVNSVKITSWNPKANDYVKFNEKAKEDASIYTMIPRPYIKVEETATGPTEITNSELAYLGYSCNGCGGLTFYGGENSILKNNDIHHIYKGFYSKEMKHMLIEGNRVYGNERYGIDPHTGTYNMTIRNNTVYDNGYSGIICSLDCYNIVIEDNEVYNNGNNGKGRGIAFSINMFDSVARNNYVHHQNIGIDISSESNDNKVYNNKISHSKVGIDTNKESSNNKVYNNTIMDSINGIVVKTGASDNIFNLNKIVNATGHAILNIKEDSDIIENTFENNKLINSKVNDATFTVEVNNDYKDKSEKEKGKEKKKK
jgi:poly(beta-D-mannuronate) C5 epimerase